MKRIENLWKSHGKSMEKHWKTYGNSMATHGKAIKKTIKTDDKQVKMYGHASWKIYGKAMGNLRKINGH